MEKICYYRNDNTATIYIIKYGNRHAIMNLYFSDGPGHNVGQISCKAGHNICTCEHDDCLKCTTRRVNFMLQRKSQHALEKEIG